MTRTDWSQFKRACEDSFKNGENSVDDNVDNMYEDMVQNSISAVTKMMMKFMFNVAAISWTMSDSRRGLVLVYNALGLMSNNVSLYVYTREVALCTGSSMYICPNSLLYIGLQGEVVHAVQFVYHSPSICRR